MSQIRSAIDAVRLIQSGHSVFVHGGVAAPKALLEALMERRTELKNVELMHLHTEVPAPYALPENHSAFRLTNFFVGSNVRPHLNYNEVDYLPCFLSEIPLLMKKGLKRPNVALIQVSPPDRNGYVTLGTSVDVARAAVDTADIVIAQINRHMPKIHGDGYLHMNDIDAAVESHTPLPAIPRRELSKEEHQVGQNIAAIVEHGSCLQLGIGAIPDAVALALKSHKHLGIHTEMWSDGVLDLLKSGAVDNSQKKILPGKTVSSFVFGSQDLYDFIDDNPTVLQLGADFVNDPGNIRQNRKVVAINSAVEIDLTGQVCADSVGSRIISGVGGQVDFIRGASLSEGGKPIFAMLSRSAKGHSKIVAQLKPGAGVVTTRAHVHWVATEYGIVNLYGKSLHERAKLMISIAHPDDRIPLEKKWSELTKRA